MSAITLRFQREEINVTQHLGDLKNSKRQIIHLQSWYVLATTVLIKLSYNSQPDQILMMYIYTAGGEQELKLVDSSFSGKSVAPQMAEIWPIWVLHQPAKLLCVFGLSHYICSYY